VGGADIEAEVPVSSLRWMEPELGKGRNGEDGELMRIQGGGNGDGGMSLATFEARRRNRSGRGGPSPNDAPVTGWHIELPDNSLILWLIGMSIGL
jgi:hypothetical protein